MKNIDKHPLYSLPVIILLTVLLSNCNRQTPLFERLSPDQTGIFFENTIQETELNNVLTNEYIYNGAGVGVADFNGNGYLDIFFAGNEVSNKLYLNKGDFRFNNVTDVAGVAGNNNKWYSGVTIIDINNNGLPDIYLSVTGNSQADLRRNELYIHQGMDENGIPQFVEKAAEYGLDDPSYTTNAVFFDSNNNGFPDVYLLVAYSGSEMSYTNILAQRESDRFANTDKLLRSEWNEQLGHPIFRDVSREAGIMKEGHGLGVQIVDINQNGFKDIYVANDYISEDLFWINNGDGTYVDRASDLFKHTSYSAMGADIADLTNNGLPDIFTLDMLPETNIRRKMMANPNNYRNYVNNAFEGYHSQYTRNTLQLNRGSADNTGLPLFSEVALLANVAATDWSWAALLADFDNDGYRDIYVTNGIPRDVTDKDFWDEYGRVRNIMPMRIALPKIPEVKIANYAFKNSGEIVFSDVTKEWGLDFETYSTGAVYADLDNSGALDLIVNNTNHPAEIYRNRLGRKQNSESSNWLKVKLIGSDENRGALGAIIDVYFGPHHQRHENTPYRGYLSSVDPILHFGLGEYTYADSVMITWPVTETGMKTILYKTDANQILTANYSDSEVVVNGDTDDEHSQLFTEVTEVRGINYRHEPSYFNDFQDQPTLPYKLSEVGPAVGVGDLSGNGLDDIFIGSTSVQPAVIYYQQEDGTFIETEFSVVGETDSTEYESVDVLIFDANGNGLHDIYIVTGGVQYPAGDEQYRDRFFENHGDGKFIQHLDAIPDVRISGSVVRAEDITGNGLPDLFIGGKVLPGRYPESVSSYLLLNVSDEDGIRFIDGTSEYAPDLIEIGNVNDARWADITGNGHNDLVLAGEWMPITIFQNNGDSFSKFILSAELNAINGWWNTILIEDITGNGLFDIVAGNLGQNSLYKASKEEPLTVYYGDLTEDGFFEAIFSTFKNDGTGNRKEFPVHHREDFVRMMPGIMSQFPTHRSFGETTLNELLNVLPAIPEIKQVNHFSSTLFFNTGNGIFDVVELPLEVQFSPIFGIHAADISGNGNLKLLLIGNLSGADLKTGEFNALNGVVLETKSDGRFFNIPVAQSGFYLPGYGRNIIQIKTVSGKNLLLTSEHNGQIKLFQF